MSQSLDILQKHIFSRSTILPVQWQSIWQELNHPDHSPLLDALIICAEQPQEFQNWLTQRLSKSFDAWSPIDKLILVSLVDDEVDDYIDTQLNQLDLAIPMARALVRAGVPWSHPGLVALLDTPRGGMAAAVLLAEEYRDDVCEWLTQTDAEASHILDIWRGIALAPGIHGAEPEKISKAYWDLAIEWQEIFAQIIEESNPTTTLSAKMNAVLAMVDPNRYARQVFLGNLDTDWFGDAQLLADYLQLYGPTEWLETLAIFEASKQRFGFEFAALLAVCAAQGTQSPQPEEKQYDDLLDFLDGNNDDIGAHKIFSFQTAIGQDNDEQLVTLLKEVAAHELLNYHELASPGILGLPFSATEGEWINWDEVDLFWQAYAKKDDFTDEEQVMIVRTLCDLRHWFQRQPDRFQDAIKTAIELFQDVSAPAISLACAQLIATLNPADFHPQSDVVTRSENCLLHSCASTSQIVIEGLMQCCQTDDIIALECARRLAEIGDNQAIEALITLWSAGPLNRGVFFRNALLASQES